MAPSRKYDLVLLGASGYTGKLCAEYITAHLPTNLSWAVAGRSVPKLQDLVHSIKNLNRDRLQPDVLAVQLREEELGSLAKDTKVLLNCVGPYYLYSTPIVAACARNGTHYFDATGETPWVRELISKYHTMAQKSNAIIIPEVGLESTPSDLVTYVAVSKIRTTLKCGVNNVTNAVYELKSTGPSGGTLATLFGILDHYSAAEIKAALGDPFALSPAPSPNRSTSRSFLSTAVGTFSYPGLGILTTSFTAKPNEAIVHRSAGLMPDLYGPNFRYAEYKRVSNYAIGILLHFGLVLASLLLTISPLRNLVKRVVYQPGQGPEIKESSEQVLEFRAIAIPDQSNTQRKAMARLRYKGGMYHMTAMILAEAAMVILKEETLVKQLGGGVLTSACLGNKLVERLQRANMEISGEMMDT